MRAWQFAAAVLIASCSLASDEECAYDQDAQIALLREVAREHPGGRLNESERRITWTRPSGYESFVYGGCHHLGSIVTYVDHSRSHNTEAQAFAIAFDLASKYWEPFHRDALRKGLEERRFTIQNLNGKLVYDIAHEEYFELSLEHELREGMNHIAITWSRNF